MALGFVRDREFFQGGFSLGEEADGKAVTQCCVPNGSRKFSEEPELRKLQSAKLILWVRAFLQRGCVPSEGVRCPLDENQGRPHVWSHQHLREHTVPSPHSFLRCPGWAGSLSPLGLALPPDPLSPHLKSVPQGGLLRTCHYPVQTSLVCSVTEVCISE